MTNNTLPNTPLRASNEAQSSGVDSPKSKDPVHWVGRYVKADLLCSEPKMTDQSYAQQCDINVIMAQYAKTGMLPNQTSVPARWIDNTTIPSLEESFNIVNRAMDAFYELPPYVRKLMDNDPSQLELFVQNPENREILQKYGMVVLDPIPEPQPAKEQAAPQIPNPKS
nr:MAG: internal scaffolding protein [Microviridae sp.]